MTHRKGSKLKRFSEEEKNGILEDYLRSGMTVKEYCINAPMSAGSLHRWLKETNNKSKIKKRQFSSLERKQAVEEFMKSGMDQRSFAKAWGINQKTISKWYSIYKKEGPKGLMSGRIYGDGKKRGRKSVKHEIKQKIIETKKNLPEHGLKKIRDFLYRFEGVKVAPNTIKKVLKEEDLFEPPETQNSRLNL